MVTIFKEPASPLLALPPELRSEIFELALTEHSPISLTAWIPPSVALTCKQLFEETLPLFCAINTFAIDFNLTFTPDPDLNDRALMWITLSDSEKQTTSSTFLSPTSTTTTITRASRPVQMNSPLCHSTPTHLSSTSKHIRFHCLVFNIHMLCGRQRRVEVELVKGRKSGYVMRVTPESHCCGWKAAEPAAEEVAFGRARRDVLLTLEGKVERDEFGGFGEEEVRGLIGSFEGVGVV